MQKRLGSYVILFAFIAIQNYGYMRLAFSKCFEEALLANAVAYLGGVITPVFCILCIADLCHQKKVNLITIPLIFTAAFLFFLVNTIGKNELYYKSIELVIEPGYSWLKKEYAPLHNLYPIYILSCMFICMGIIVKAYLNKKYISYITSTILFVSMSTMVGIYFVERILHLKLELISYSFLFLEISVLILLNRINNYDTWSISSSSIKESRQYGFVIFNSKGRLYGADSIARAWFEELNELSIDRTINSTSTDFLQQIHAWLEIPKIDEVKYFERNDNIIEAKLSIVKQKNALSIYCVSLRDDTEHQKFDQFLSIYNSELERKVEEKTAQLAKVQDDIILNMASTVESRDANTGGHIKRTSDVVRIFVNHLFETQNFPNLTKDFSQRVIKAAPLHDFGKIGIPDNILNKPGKFEPFEYEIMKTHSEKGAGIVSKILQNSPDTDFRDIAVNVAHFHHEKWDGKGYPKGLSGENIPFEARIMALADVFDALVSKRVYKENFSYDKAFSIIEESSGNHFDPNLCQEFLKCRPQLEELFNSYEE